MPFIQSSSFRRGIRVHSPPNLETLFTQIYQRSIWAWDQNESRSGIGSMFEHTAVIRSELEQLCARLQIKSLLDAPCGDFNWMRHVNLPPNCQYIGYDTIQSGTLYE